MLLKDQYTGNYINVFIRRGKVYAFLVDRYSFMFIKRLDEIYEYCSANVVYASKDKPLFLDVLITVRRTPEEVYYEESKRKEIKDDLRRFIRENYNEWILDEMKSGTRWFATELVKGCGYASTLPYEIREMSRWKEALFLAQARKDDPSRARTGVTPKIGGRYPFPL